MPSYLSIFSLCRVRLSSNFFTFHKPNVSPLLCNSPLIIDSSSSSKDLNTETNIFFYASTGNLNNPSISSTSKSGYFSGFTSISSFSWFFMENFRNFSFYLIFSGILPCNPLNALRFSSNDINNNIMGNAG